MPMGHGTENNKENILNKIVVFDYGSGNLRQCRLYSLQELIVLGEIYLQNEEKKGDTK